MGETKMLLANAERTTAMLASDGGFSYTYAGWNITTPPPVINGPNNYPPSPTVPVLLQAANGAWIKSQTVTPSNSNTQNLNASGTIEDDHWITIGGDSKPTPINLTLNTPVIQGLTYECSITLTLNMAACAPGPAHYRLEVNGKQIGTTLSPTDQNWHSESISIPANVLRNGANQINILYDGNDYGIWVQSITVVSNSINISASSQWLQICCGFLYKGDTFNITQTITKGITTEDSTTETYGQEFGISTSIGGLEGLLSGLSTQLSASFSSQHSTEHSVSISKQTTESWGPNINAVNSDITYQVWQLGIVYEANGKQIVQALGKEGPIITCHYPS